MGLVYNYQPANRTCFPSHVLSIIVEIISVFDRPKFCFLLFFFICEHHYGVEDIQPACSHCIPQLANHAAFVISTIWTDTAFSLSRSLPSSLIWTERLLWKGEERQQSVKAIGYTVPSAIEWDYESLAGWHCFDCLSSIPDFQLCFSHTAHDGGDARGETERIRQRKREGEQKILSNWMRKRKNKSIPHVVTTHELFVRARRPPPVKGNRCLWIRAWVGGAL